MPKIKGKRRSSRPMRLPNGFGSIVYLGKGRHKPYAAKTPTESYTDDGYPVRKTLGYYETWDEAYVALSDYKKNPYDVDILHLTFSDLYEIWWKRKYEGPNCTLSKSNRYVSKAAYAKCAPLHNRVFREIKSLDMQALLDSLLDKYKYASLEHVKSLLNQMYNTAMELDMVDKNYAQFIKINKADDDEHGVAFTRAEVDQMWSCVDTVPDIDMVLVMIYSGHRILEYKTLKVDLDSLTFTGGVKTIAGKGRVVPIHHRIIPLVKKLLADGRLFGIDQNTNRNAFKAAVAASGVELANHTPHDCRHTLATFMSDAGANEICIKNILGHSVGTDVTQKVYIHKSLDELRKAVEMVN